MKKTLLLSALALGAMSAMAQNAIQQPWACDNWSVGINGGAATPLVNYPFFSSMRGVFGATVAKQITPVVGLGVEGQAGINTSSWAYHSNTAIDNSYVGAFTTIDLCNWFGGYHCATRPFTIAAVAGAGWGHDYYTKHDGPDHNFFATKAGLNFNFNLSDHTTFYLQPSVVWDMSDARVSQTSAAYDARKATFNIVAGFNFALGGRNFNCVEPVVALDPAVIDALNAQINDLRGQLANANSATQKWQNNARDLQKALDECNNREPEQIVTTEVVTEVNNYLNSVRYVFFKIGSSVITADQMPNVEMIAAYLKNHPGSTVQIKGYASQDGNEEFNIKLANNRAQAAKDALINKYKVSADRIQAEGQGIGHMFEEESWNRVSICVINAAE